MLRRVDCLEVAFTIATVAILASSAAATPLLEPAETRLVLADVEPDAAPEAGSVQIRLAPAGYRALWDAGMATVEGFPLPGGQRVDLHLRPFQVLAPDAVVINVDESGEEQRVRPSVRFVRGTVAGDVDSSVVLGLFQNRIAGVVKTRDQAFGVGPEELSIDAAGAMRLRVWDRALEHGEWDCAVTHEASNLAASIIDFEAIGAESQAPEAPLGGGAQLSLDLAIDSTTEWCANFGDDSTAAQNYLLNAVAQISAIYDAEILEIFQVVYLRTFCGAADPYTDGLGINDRSQLLSELDAEWTANQAGVSRTVAHLFSKSDTGSAGGLANTVTCSGPSCQAVLCSTTSGYGVTVFPATGGAPAGFEVAVAAHEFGHNHSSPHTNCLQDGGGAWLSTCAINSCGLNPWCQATGCFTGPVDTAITGTLMSTGCGSRVSEIEDTVVESIMRSSAEAASCIGAAGSPGAVREDTGGGLRLALPDTCPAADLINDDGSADSAFGGSGATQLAWIKRFTPACYPFRVTRVDTLIWNDTVAIGRPIRVLVYSDPSGSGDPANASLVYAEDVTVQTVGFSAFNEYTLASPVTVASGDLYIGLFDLVADAETNFIGSTDSSASGDSWQGFNTTAPGSYAARTADTFMIRGQGGPVVAGSVELSWGLPCNDTGVPGQDFGVYRGDIGSFGTYGSLTCTTNTQTTYFAEGAPDDSFFLVVPQTTPSEGSYGIGSGVERSQASVPCKPQAIGSCP